MDTKIIDDLPLDPEKDSSEDVKTEEVREEPSKQESPTREIDEQELQRRMKQASAEKSSEIDEEKDNDEPEYPEENEASDEEPASVKRKAPTKRSGNSRRKKRVMIGKIPLIAIVKITALVAVFLLLVFLLAGIISSERKPKEITVSPDAEKGSGVFLAVDEDVLGIVPISGGAAVLSPSRVQYVNAAGRVEKTTDHSYVDPALLSSGQYLLAYDRGGDKLRLETKGQILFEEQTDPGISCAAINAKGCFAYVVNASKGYQSHLYVKDRRQQLLFEWGGSDYVLNLALSPNSKRVALCELCVSQGAKTGRVVCFDVNSTDPLFQSDFTDAVVYDIFFLNNHLLGVFTENGVFTISADGTRTEILTYSANEMNSYAHFPSGRNAVALNLYANNRNVYLAMFDYVLSASSLKEQNFDEPVQSVLAGDRFIAAVFDSRVRIFDKKNTETGSVILNDTITHAALSGRTLFVETKNGMMLFDVAANYTVEKD